MKILNYGLNVAYVIFHLGSLRNVVGKRHFHNHAVGYHHTVGKILNILGTKEVITAVAQPVGNIYAQSIERIGAVAAAHTQVSASARKRVDILLHGRTAAGEHHSPQLARRGEVYGVIHTRLLGIALVILQLVCRARPEVAVIFERAFNHFHAQRRAHVGNQYRLGCQLLVYPVLEPLSGSIVPMVIHPQPHRERVAYVRRVKAVVRLHVDCGKHLVLHTAYYFLTFGGVIRNMLDTGIQHFVVGKAARG